MTPKKKRTYWAVVNEDLDVYLDMVYSSEERAKKEYEYLKRCLNTKFKVLRVTLTASPAGWK